jgi:hypothetical protein
MASQWLCEKSVRYQMATAHFSTEASEVDHPTGYFGSLSALFLPLLFVCVLALALSTVLYLLAYSVYEESSIKIK